MFLVADDEDKTSDTDSNAVNQDVSIPEVIQIDDNDGKFNFDFTNIQ